MCQREDGSYDDRQRAVYGCTRSDLPPVAWNVSVDRVCFHLGRQAERGYVPPPEVGAGLADAWRFPLEEPQDGCPGGDQVCRFVDSVMTFARKRDGHGGRVPNPLLDRSNDWLLFEAVLWFEHDQDRAVASRQQHDEELLEEKARDK